MQQIKLEYSFVKTEADGTFVLFIMAPQELLGVDLDFLLLSSGQVAIKTVNKQYTTDVLPPDLFAHLRDKKTNTIFTNTEGEPIFAHEFPPFVATS